MKDFPHAEEKNVLFLALWKAMFFLKFYLFYKRGKKHTPLFQIEEKFSFKKSRKEIEKKITKNEDERLQEETDEKKKKNLKDRESFFFYLFSFFPNKLLVLLSILLLHTRNKHIIFYFFAQLKKYKNQIFQFFLLKNSVFLMYFLSKKDWKKNRLFYDIAGGWSSHWSAFWGIFDSWKTLMWSKIVFLWPFFWNSIIFGKTRRLHRNPPFL